MPPNNVKCPLPHTTRQVSPCRTKQTKKSEDSGKPTCMNPAKLTFLFVHKLETTTYAAEWTWTGRSLLTFCAEWNFQIFHDHFYQRCLWFFRSQVRRSLVGHLCIWWTNLVTTVVITCDCSLNSRKKTSQQHYQFWLEWREMSRTIPENGGTTETLKYYAFDDWAVDYNDWKSNSVNLVFLGGSLVSWEAKPNLYRHAIGWSEAGSVGIILSRVTVVKMTFNRSRWTFRTDQDTGRQTGLELDKITFIKATFCLVTGFQRR